MTAAEAACGAAAVIASAPFALMIWTLWLGAYRDAVRAGAVHTDREKRP